MDKIEVLKFLEDLINNDLFSDEYKSKFKEVSSFVAENVKDSVKKVKIGTKVAGLELIHNEVFPEGKNFTIYTDGGCLVNPGGPGGYGIVILGEDYNETISKGYIATTNNRMELMGPIEALSRIPEGSNVVLYSDSTYFGNPINKNWIESWLNSNWKDGTIKNIDLWEKFIPLYNKHHIEIVWVKGHADNEYNEMCDKLATQAYSDTENLIEDEGFEG